MRWGGNCGSNGGRKAGAYAPAGKCDLQQKSCKWWSFVGVCEKTGRGGISGWLIGREKGGWRDGMERRWGCHVRSGERGEGLLRARVGSIYRTRYTYFEY
jgi:hypothetical protein